MSARFCRVESSNAKVGFVERALRGDQIHWARIFWTVTQQHIGVLTGGSANYLSPFVINFYRGMELLTDAEKKKFPLQTHAQDEEEILSANEVDTDSKDEQIDSPQGRTNEPRERRKERPRKRRKLQEVAVSKARDYRQVSIKLRTPNARAMTKVKADKSMKTSVAASQGRLISAQWAELEAETTVREKDGPSKKNLWTSEMRCSAVVKRRAMRKEKEKAIMTEEGTSERNQVASTEARVSATSERPAEVLTVSSSTEQDRVALEMVAKRVVKGVAGESTAQQPVASLRTSMGMVILETTRVKVATAQAIAEKERQVWKTEAKYDALRKRLAETVELRKSSEKTGGSLWADIEAHVAKVAAKMKALAECEATRTSDLELIEKLEAKCNEMRSQRSLAEELLSEMEVKLSEAEEKNRQLAEQTNNALTEKVNRCLCKFVLWQVETQK
ncbi:hypothetical protein AXG93_1084s1020 [Marchantia polymorpha subsp. ruderalis]|uniref:Uncharacterized protein n=1 Tax=Marchantia polymorpha subsp. ruderalis TaxID=1480154 RepID=A0A176VHG4_MARPO|nr:hypothetical protein AXG93_1084s1020 [Marchantia polymorpha subsp. ruderalis]